MATTGPRGVDVSQHQGSVQWQQVRGAGHRFAIVKCSEGQDFIDPVDGSTGTPDSQRLAKLRARCAEIREQDMVLGVYHFLRPRPGRTGDVEANFAIRTARAIGWGEQGDLRLAVDVEVTALGRAATHRYLGQFIRRVVELVGHKPLIYTFPFFWQTLGNPKNFGCPLWIAHFEVDNPSVPAPWEKAAIWQHSYQGSVPGIQGHVDLNRAMAALPRLSQPISASQDEPMSGPAPTQRERLVARLRRARERFLATGSNAALRVWLISKARLGRWDDRYCMFFGVDPGVTPQVRAYITRAYAAGLVPTSTTGGAHSPNSFHFQRINGKGRAADIGLRNELIGTQKGLNRMIRFQSREFARRQTTQPVELIGPDNNRCVLGAADSVLAEGTPLENQHDNHVHAAF